MKSAQITLLFSVFILSVSPLTAQGLPANFRQLLEQNSMQYQIPPGFTPIPVLENGDVVYDYAVKSKTAKFEIRYRIWPIDRRAKNNPNKNAIYDPMIVTMALNISNGKMIRPTHLPTADVKKGFGADAAAVGGVPTESHFGKGYKFCMIFAIHKDDVADAYVFFMSDDPEAASEIMFTDKVYHALKFK